MAAITTRETAGTGATVAGVPLTNAQLDNNFISINTELVLKAEYPSLTGNSGKYLTTNGTTVSWEFVPLPNGQTSGSTTSGYLQYSGTTKTDGQFYGGTSTPSSTTRLNYDGYLHATRFVGDGSQLTGLPLPGGQTSGSSTAGYLQYSGTTKTDGQLYGGTTVPNNTTRLNYDGYLYATRFYGDGSQLTGISALPSQTGNSGKYLTTDGTTASWNIINSTINSTILSNINFTAPTAALAPVPGTVLLLNKNSVNGSQNNTFIDSSSNNFTVTRPAGANVTQGGFSPFLQTSWSNYFDGNGDFLTVPASANFAYGTGAFTVEAWVYPTAGGVDQIILSQSVSGTNYFLCYINASNQPAFSYSTSTLVSSSAALIPNSWNHIAWVREGTGTNQFKIYLNGINTATNTVSTDFTNTTYVPTIGRYTHSATLHYTGYINNLRVVKGTAVYTATFTPPQSNLTAITNTQLLTCQNNRFTDSSANNLTVTRNGDVATIAFSPVNLSTVYDPALHGGGGYFDGTGDYLTVADNAVLDMGSSNFTIECWWYPTVFMPAAISGLFGKRATSSTFAGVLVDFAASSMAPRLNVTLNGTSWGIQITSTVFCIVGQWNHIAVVRNGDSWNLYVNGVSGVSTTFSGTIPDNASAFSIGATAADGTLPIPASYISSFRVVKGTAVYTAPFTPPTTALTAITNTSLLLNFANAGIYDLEGCFNVETAGNVQVSTTQAKYGTTSMYFDGAGDYLAIPTNPLLALGTGDFTIEFWLYLNSTATSQLIYEPRTAANQVTPVIYVAAGGTIRYYVSAADRLVGPALTAGSWNHIAVCRTGSNTKMFVNGTSIGSTYVDTNNYVSVNTRIGIDLSGTSPLNGYIDDFRIVRGSAVYGAIRPNSSTTDQLSLVSIAESINIYNTVSTPLNGQKLVFRIKDNGVARALNWSTAGMNGYRVIGTTLPTTTVANKTTYVGCVYNSTDFFWDVTAVTTEV